MKQSQHKKTPYIALNQNHKMKTLIYLSFFTLSFASLKAQITDTVTLQNIFSEIQELNPTSEIILDEGWNFISLGGCHNHQDISFFDDFEEVIVIKNYLGDVYLPSWEFDNIGQLDVGKAYWIKLSAAIEPLNFCEGVSMPIIDELNLDTLNLIEIYNTLREMNPPIEHTFHQGWNMFESGCKHNIIIDQTLLASYFTLIKRADGAAWISAWTWGLSHLEPNKGYLGKSDIDFGPVSFCEGIHLPAYPGCIDEEALNYNSLASEDDGTCEYE